MYRSIAASLRSAGSISRHSPCVSRSSLSERNGCRAWRRADGRAVAMMSSRVLSSRRGQVPDEVSRRRIGPVHVVEPEHDRLHPSGFFEQRRDLALEPLLRPARGFGGQPRRGRIVLGRRHELRVPARRERADEAREAAKLLALLQAFERLEYGQVSLASGEPLGASAAADRGLVRHAPRARRRTLRRAWSCRRRPRPR